MKSPETELQALLDQLVAGGRERGVQLAVYFRGELAVNIQAGVMREGGAPVTEETMFPVFSVSKGLASTILHRLSERGLFSLDTRIAEVWPEFGVNGKERITIRHALDHTSGIPFMPGGISLKDLGDWDTMCAAIAGLRPVSKPGERSDYHAMTFGWIVGEFARRADGRSFPELFADEVCTPLSAKSLFIGLPDSEAGRVAVLEDTDPDVVPPDDDTLKPIPVWLYPLHMMMNDPAAQRACIPATSGVMNAENMARHYAAMILGGVNGVELISPARVAEIIGNGAPEGEVVRSLGYQVVANPSGGFTVRHPGFGGSTAFADVSDRLAVGFTRNLFGDDESVALVIDRVRKAFGLLSKG